MQLALQEVLFFAFFIVSIKSLGSKIEQERKVSNNSRSDEGVEVKIGLLVGSQRLKHDLSQPRPGRQFLYAFNYAIWELNERFRSASIKFAPIVAETFGVESESIRQTISLLTKHNVNFILGPQETCQVESRLAAIYNVAMISHFCSHWPPPPPPQSLSKLDVCKHHDHQLQPASTLIQSKPPPWKIVQQVVALVSELLKSRTKCYPRRLVLLYYKKHPTEDQSRGGNGTSTGEAEGDDALQYRLIGELLEFELGQLISNKGERFNGIGQLSVYNWHSSFHYGHTRNPFRSIVRRQLFQHQRSSETALPLQCQLQETSSPWPDWLPLGSKSEDVGHYSRSEARGSKASRAAIYIVVGHHYEHLGLMLALNELNLLNSPPHEPQPSVSINQKEQQEERPRLNCNAKRGGSSSMVIGVDIEQYDGRDDSVRFLRGLLMDDNSGFRLQRLQADLRNRVESSPTRDEDPLQSLASSYRRYLGVMPSHPSAMPGFLQQMRAYYNQSSSSAHPVSSSTRSEDSYTGSDPIPDLNHEKKQVEPTPLLDHTWRRMFHLIRMPVESFYLYKSLMQLGIYLNECLSNQSLSLCSDGARVRHWFDQQTNYDRDARFKGSFALIGFQGSRSENSTAEGLSSTSEDEVGLLNQIGEFSERQGGKIILGFNINDLDPFWLPLACQVDANSSELCNELTRFSGNSADGYEEDEEKISESNFYVHTVVGLMVAGCLLSIFLLSHATYSNRPALSTSLNEGWFSKSDEDNFLQIVHGYLLAPEAASTTFKDTATKIPAGELAIRDHNADGSETTSDRSCLMSEISSGDEDAATGRGKTSKVAERTKLDLHCRMFSFPSCRFAHWVSALYQLKEMMFQYQFEQRAELELDGNHQAYSVEFWSRLAGFMRASCGVSVAGSSEKSSSTTRRPFFASQHKSTASLRMLLNKYKQTNRAFCRLASLKHENVARLLSLSSGFAESSSGGVNLRNADEHLRVAHLVLESPVRGNLRLALEHLNELKLHQQEAQRGKTHTSGMCQEGNLSLCSFDRFKSKLVLSILQDLLAGLQFLHSSQIGFHSKLMPTNCLLTYDWRLRLSGFHENHMRRSLGQYELKSINYSELVYSAPEVIEQSSRVASLSPDTLRLADIFSFAFLMFEILVNKEPWSCLTNVTDPKLLAERLASDASFRPPLNVLGGPPVAEKNLDQLRRLMRSCWSESVDRRPQSIEVLKRRIEMCFPLSGIDNDGNPSRLKTALMKDYLETLESELLKSKLMLDMEREAGLKFKLQQLPPVISDKLKRQEPISSQIFEHTALCLFRFAFNHKQELSQQNMASKIVDSLGILRQQLTALLSSYKNHLHLLESDLDCSLKFMVVSGALTSDSNTGANAKASKSIAVQLVASFSLQLIELTNKFQAQFHQSIQVRCALHCGSVAGGLIESASTRSGLCGGNSSLCLGAKGAASNEWRYVLFGSSIQLLEALELSSLHQRVQISAQFRDQLLEQRTSSQRSTSNSLNLNSFDPQGYVIIKREARIQSSTFGDFEAYWLLNGPRLTPSASLLL